MVRIQHTLVRGLVGQLKHVAYRLVIRRQVYVKVLGNVNVPSHQWSNVKVVRANGQVR